LLAQVLTYKQFPEECIIESLLSKTILNHLSRR
jgi:hypothetical protein